MTVRILFFVWILSSCNKIENKTSFPADTANTEQSEINLKKDTITLETIKSPYTDSIVLEIEIFEKDWWESLYLSRIKKGETERIFKKPIPITSQSILFAQFVDIRKKKSIYFEVFDMTHQGNGYFNLFEYREGSLNSILKIRGVDINQEMIGITGDTSFIIKDARLKSEYIDLNKDGHKDIKFTGVGYVIQGDLISKQEIHNLKNPILLERQFIWNETENKFVELINKRKGFWYYNKNEIDY